jgi:methionine-rich copper-binding protein CopC
MNNAQSRFVSLSRYRILGILFSLVVAFGITLTAAPALAHSELESSTPAEGSSVSKLTEFTLTFGEEVVPEFSKYSLVDEMGMVVALGAPKYDVSKTTVTVPVTGELMNAKYVIGFAILSIDGHPIAGKVNFVSTAAVLTPTNSATATVTFTPAPSAQSDFGANIGYAVGGLAAGVIVVAVITVVVRRRQKQ